MGRSLAALQSSLIAGTSFNHTLGRGLLRIPFALQSESAVVKALMRDYRNVPMSLADVCLVRMAELDGTARVWTTDSHFQIYRRHGREPIALVAPF